MAITKGNLVIINPPNTIEEFSLEEKENLILWINKLNISKDIKDKTNEAIIKTYSVLGLDYAKLTDINKNLDDNKLNDSILKKISPKFYINKGLIESLVNNNKITQSQ